MADMLQTGGLPPVAPGDIIITDLAPRPGSGMTVPVGAAHIQIGRVRKPKLIWISETEMVLLETRLRERRLAKSRKGTKASAAA